MATFKSIFICIFIFHSFLVFADQALTKELGELKIRDILEVELTKLEKINKKDRIFIYQPRGKGNREKSMALNLFPSEIRIDQKSYFISEWWNNFNEGLNLSVSLPRNYSFLFQQSEEKLKMIYKVFNNEIVNLDVFIGNSNSMMFKVIRKDEFKIVKNINAKYLVDEETIKNLKNLDLIVNKTLASLLKTCGEKSSSFCAMIKSNYRKVETSSSVEKWAIKKDIYANQYLLLNNEPNPVTKLSSSESFDFLKTLKKNKDFQNGLLSEKGYDFKSNKKLYENMGTSFCTLFYTYKRDKKKFVNVIYYTRAPTSQIDCIYIMRKTVRNQGSLSCVNSDQNQNKILSFGMKGRDLQAHIKCDDLPFAKQFERNAGEKYNKCFYQVDYYRISSSKDREKKNYHPYTYRTKEECVEDFKINIGENNICGVVNKTERVKIAKKIKIFWTKNNNDYLIKTIDCPKSNQSLATKVEDEEKERRLEKYLKGKSIEDFNQVLELYEEFVKGDSMVDPTGALDTIFTDFSEAQKVIYKPKFSTRYQKKSYKKKTARFKWKESFDLKKFKTESNKIIKLNSKFNGDVNLNFYSCQPKVEKIKGQKRVDSSMYSKTSIAITENKIFILNSSKKILEVLQSNEHIKTNKIYNFKLTDGSTVSFWGISDGNNTRLEVFSQVNDYRRILSCDTNRGHQLKEKMIFQILSYDVISNKKINYKDHLSSIEKVYRVDLRDLSKLPVRSTHVDGKALKSELEENKYILNGIFHLRFDKSCYEYWKRNLEYTKDLYPKAKSLLDIKFKKIEVYGQNVEVNNLSTWSKVEIEYAFYKENNIYDSSFQNIQVCIKMPYTYLASSYSEGVKMNRTLFFESSFIKGKPRNAKKIKTIIAKNKSEKDIFLYELDGKEVRFEVQYYHTLSDSRRIRTEGSLLFKGKEENINLGQCIKERLNVKNEKNEGFMSCFERSDGNYYYQVTGLNWVGDINSDNKPDFIWYESVDGKESGQSNIEISGESGYERVSIQENVEF